MPSVFHDSSGIRSEARALARGQVYRLVCRGGGNKNGWQRQISYFLEGSPQTGVIFYGCSINVLWKFSASRFVSTKVLGMCPPAGRSTTLRGTVKPASKTLSRNLGWPPDKARTGSYPDWARQPFSSQLPSPTSLCCPFTMPPCQSQLSGGLR